MAARFIMVEGEGRTFDGVGATGRMVKPRDMRFDPARLDQPEQVLCIARSGVAHKPLSITA
jgi:hypothetical protein